MKRFVVFGLAVIAVLVVVTHGAAHLQRHGDPARARLQANELARQLILTPADLPGFTRIPVSFAPGNDVEFERCLGVTLSQPLASAHSASYAHGASGAHVVSWVAVLPTAAVAQREFAVEGATRGVACLVREATKELSGARFGQLRMSFAPLTRSRPGVSAVRFKVELSNQGRRVTEFSDSLTFLRGAAVVSLNVTSAGRAAPASLERRVIALLMVRAERAIR